MNLKSLLLSSDENTVRILRRVLSDLEIGAEHVSTVDGAIRLITRTRFDAIIVDSASIKAAGSLMKAAQAAPVNKRALLIVLVEPSVGLKGGFEMGAHFVLYKPLAVERAKSSFRAVRALIKRERRLQLRVPVQVPVECKGTNHYKAKTIDLCEGGMALQFSRRVTKETSFKFCLELPGLGRKLEILGELAWAGTDDQVGVRFKNPTDEQRQLLRDWLAMHLPESEQDDPLICRLTDMSIGGCYLTTDSPFPRGARVILSIKSGKAEMHAGGVVLVTHPEFGMGVQFLQTTAEQQDQVHNIITALRKTGETSPELHVEADGMEEQSPADGLGKFKGFAGLGPPRGAAPNEELAPVDALVELFREKYQLPVETFMQELREQRQAETTHSR